MCFRGRFIRQEAEAPQTEKGSSRVLSIGEGNQRKVEKLTAESRSGLAPTGQNSAIHRWREGPDHTVKTGWTVAVETEGMMEYAK